MPNKRPLSSENEQESGSSPKNPRIIGTIRDNPTTNDNAPTSSAEVSNLLYRPDSDGTYARPSTIPRDRDDQKQLITSKLMSEMDYLIRNINVCLDAARKGIPISERVFTTGELVRYKYHQPNAHQFGGIVERLANTITKLSLALFTIGEIFAPDEVSIDISTKRFAIIKYRLQHTIDACRILSPVMHHFGSIIIPCFTPHGTEVLPGTKCLRMVSTTNSTFEREIRNLESKLNSIQAQGGLQNSRSYPN